MMPKINPRQMQRLMKQMGIQSENIDAKRVVIERDEGNIIIENPSVVKVKSPAGDTFQISGAISEEQKEEKEFTEDDVKMVIEQAKCSKEEAEKALKESGGDLAQAILSLQKQQK